MKSDNRQYGIPDYDMKPSGWEMVAMVLLIIGSALIIIIYVVHDLAVSTVNTG